MTTPAATPRQHELKTWPEFFRAIKAGRKRHEVRENDRDYQVGDVLVLREFEPNGCGYTGESVRVRVIYATAAFLPAGLIAMSVELEPAPEATDGLRERLRALARAKVDRGALMDERSFEVKLLQEAADALATLKAKCDELKTKLAKYEDIIGRLNK